MKDMSDRNVMAREVSEALYGVGTYIVCSLCVGIMVLIVANTLYLIIFYAMIDMPWDKFGAFYGWCLLMFLVYGSMMAWIGAASKDIMATQAYMPLISVIMVFDGYSLTKKSVASWLRWMFYITPQPYIMEQLQYHFWNDVPVSEGANVTAWETLKETFDYEKSSPTMACVVCFIYILVFRILQVICLSTVKIAK